MAAVAAVVPTTPPPLSSPSSFLSHFYFNNGRSAFTTSRPRKPSSVRLRAAANTRRIQGVFFKMLFVILLPDFVSKDWFFEWLVCSQLWSGHSGGAGVGFWFGAVWHRKHSFWTQVCSYYVKIETCFNKIFDCLGDKNGCEILLFHWAFFGVALDIY